MVYKIFCLKFKKKLNSLNYFPFPGKLGKRILNNISKKAWNLWLKNQTILINEKKLILSNIKHRKYLLRIMNEFFFKKNI